MTTELLTTRAAALLEALRFLEEASDQLSVVIDTIKQAQAAAPAERLDLTSIGRAEGLTAMAAAQR